MASSAGASFQDRTLNKVAVCSAVFAGFAYVGYSYARTAFCRKISTKNNTEDTSDGRQIDKVVFRRLSQTTQTDALLGNLDMTSGSGRLIIRPKTVQERIRELNLKARQFTDAFIAIQTGNEHSGQALTRSHAVHGPTSLHCSPWGSPRLLSPVDVKHLIISRSTENLTHIPIDSSPNRHKWKKKSLHKRKSKIKNESCEEQQQRLEQEATLLLEDDIENLQEKMQSLSLRGRVITPYEARSLVALLYSPDKSLVERTLVTIANCAAFSLNLDFFREVGCIHKLTELLVNTELRLPAVQTLGNVVLSEENIRQAKDCIPVLMEYVLEQCQDEALTLASLVVLTNLATTSEWHELYCPLLHRLYQLVDSPKPHLQLQSLRLLVNLSCNHEMIPSLLAAEGPRKLTLLVSIDRPEHILLRVLSLLTTLASAVTDDQLDPSVDLPPQDKAAAPDTMCDYSSQGVITQRYACLFGVGVRDKLEDQTLQVMQKHADNEIKGQAHKLYRALQE